MRIRIPYITTSLETDIVITLYLAPLWWVLGFSIFIYHLVTFWLLIKLTVLSITTNGHIRVPRITAFLILLIIIYGLSLLINYPQNEPIRTLASLYNYSFWLMGLALIIVVYNSFNTESIREITAPLKFNVIVIGILALISVILWFLGYKEIRYPSFVLQLLPLMEKITHLKASSTISLVHTDWFASRPFPRASIMSPYSTAMADAIILSIPLIFANFKEKKMKRYILLFLGGAAILSSLARTATLSFLVAIAIVYTLTRRHRYGFIILAVPVVIFLLPYFGEIFDWFSELRGGSSATRFNVYKETISQVWKENPLIGIGVKPREEWINVPIGSHSMYLSLFLKTGFMGLCAFIVFEIHILSDWFSLLKERASLEIQNLYSSIGVSLISAPLFLLTEDLDAPQLMAFLYFLIIGIFCVLTKDIRSLKDINDENEKRAHSRRKLWG